MSFGPLSRLESDACLIEDVVRDARTAWPDVKAVPITPRSLDRLQATLTRLNSCADSLTTLRVELHAMVRDARRQIESRGPAQP